MNCEFTVDEIREVIRAARIFCPGFSETQYQNLMTLEKRLADSGYLEAVHGLVLLEKEKGILCTEALDACKQLLREKEQLEGESADLRQKLLAQQNANREAEHRFRQLNEDIEKARQELQAVRAERQREEKELLAFKKKAERERQQIDENVAQCREKAKVTEEQIINAGQLNAEVESRGFSLRLLLDLCKEFAGHENAREELSRALMERRTISEYVAHLREQANSQKVDLDRLKAEKDRRQVEINGLEQARHQMEGILAELQANLAEQEELRSFYRRYWGVRGLMQCLASWNQIFFLRCNNPLSALAGVFDRSAAGAHFWTDKPATRCPHCGLTMLIYDEKPYQALNWPVGDPLRLQLGE